MKGVEKIEHTLHNLASPKRGHTFWGLLAVLMAAFFLIWAKHGDWLAAPNGVMFAKSNIGFKNYMTSAWHVQHDSSYAHYGGMNYPFGEHVLFTDNQPMMSAAMQWWSRHVFDVGDQVIGIIHGSLVLSVLFGVCVLYLLMRKLHLPVWYAGLAALGIAFLSPQHNRFDAQFGLSHIWVLPMLLHLLCRYEERSSRRYQSLLIGILVWFSSQFHFYHLGVSAVFLGFYTLFQILLNFSWRNIWTRVSHLAGMILLPFAGLNVWLHWSDYCPDRPAAPVGFTEYIGHWEGVFLPYDFFPVHQWISRHIAQIRALDLEAQSYAGLVVLFFTVWLLFWRRFRLFEPKWDHAAYHRVHKNYLRGICFAAFATLVFSLGFPFSIKGLEWMVDYLGPIRQFRGLGRFSWAFYYSINVLAFYILWNNSQRVLLGEKWLAFARARSAGLAKRLPEMLKWSVALIPLTVLCWEAYCFQKHKTLSLMPNLAQKGVVAASPDHWLNKVDFARFQSLMPLPYYHVGSENLWLEVDQALFQKVQYTALQTGVPDMGVNMSRSAVSRTVKSVQFALTACETPALLSELPDNRPIALMIEPNRWEEVRKKYRHLTDKASTVYAGPALKIMALVPDSVRSWSQQEAEKMVAEMDRVATFDAGAGWRSDRPPLWYRAINYDSFETNEYAFQGKGSGVGNLGDTTWLWKNPMPKGDYLFSIWIKADEDLGMTQSVKFLENSLKGNGSSHFRELKLRTGIQMIVQGWALFEIPFEVVGDGSNLGIFLHEKHVNAPFWYDEVMIRDKRFNLYRQMPAWVIRNNFWYKLPVNPYQPR